MLNSQETSSESGVRRYACIDCGTNSVKLIVADLGMNRADRVFETSATTRMGEGMHAHGMAIQEAPMRRTIDAIAGFVEAARSHQALDTAIVGTAALRDAVNRQEFLNRLEERCGVKMDVIPGEEEARLSFLAVRRDPHWTHSPRLLVIDIGGGSTEIIQGAPQTASIEARMSVNIGAVKLTERYLKSDPPTAAELQAAQQAAAQAFHEAPLPAPTGPASQLVGVGGTFTNLGAMMLAASTDPEQLHGYTLQAEDLEKLCARLAAASVAERRTWPGLEPGRADIILGGVVLLLHALARVGSNRIDVSTRGLRWGVLYDRFLSNAMP